MRTADRFWEEAQEDDVIKYRRLVGTRPADALVGLKRSAAGCRWLIAQWEELERSLAAAQARSGQYEQAINSYKELAQRKDGGLPVDGILMELGRVYRDAGRASDAQQTFNRLIEEFPESPFNADAKRELDALKKAKTA